VSRLIFRWGNCRRGGGGARTRMLSWLLAAPALVLAHHVAVAAEAKRVLVLYPNSRLSPANIAIDSGLRQVFEADPGHPIEIFSEFLDEPQFGGDRYELTVSTYLREKYADRAPSAVIAGSDALRLLLRYRDRLFPAIPIVHAAVTRSTLQSLGPLPPDVVGTPIAYEFAGTVKQALRWHPSARHLVVVTGASMQDASLEAELRTQIAPILGSVRAEYLKGLSLPTLQKRLRELGGDSVVLTTGFYKDGDGHVYVPRDAAALVAAASSAPVYTPAETFMGTGVVGGRMLSYAEVGRQAAQIVERLFKGDPDWNQVPEAAVSVLEVDWRQVKRWGIDPAQLPPDTVVAFRPPTLWQTYRNAVLGAVTIILLLSGLVASLLLERRRRRMAEIAVQKQHLALAHASRLAVAGELTAAIAHEINQPLGAVQTNADTAEVILQAGGDRREDLLRLVGRIRNDNQRASDVIKRLRALLARHEARRQPLDLNEVLTDVEAFLRSELQRRELTLTPRSAEAPARILGDETQIQQVLINLIMNAMEALTNAPADRRLILVEVERAAGMYSVAVKDQGPGFADSDLSKLFDSFFSTKKTGMGLGLSIARTIVEAHGGTIRAERGPNGGAVFHVELPAHDVSETQYEDRDAGKTADTHR
jgi:signal transduction histidine kinase